MSKLVPESPDWHLYHDPKVLAVHSAVDEEVSRAGAGQQEVAQVGDVGDPLRPRNSLWAVILKEDSLLQPSIDATMGKQNLLTRSRL